jgi:hypothetical protein
MQQLQLLYFLYHYYCRALRPHKGRSMTAKARGVELQSWDLIEAARMYLTQGKFGNELAPSVVRHTDGRLSSKVNKVRQLPCQERE